MKAVLNKFQTSGAKSHSLINYIIMSDISPNKDSKVGGTMDNIKTSDVIISKPNLQLPNSGIKTSGQPKDLKQSKEEQQRSVQPEMKKSKGQEDENGDGDAKQNKSQEPKQVQKEAKQDKGEDVKPVTKTGNKDGGDQKKVPGKGEAKLRNLLKDPRVLQDVENLFEDLKGSKTDDFVDSSTILFLFNMLEISKTEPEYYWYIYTQVKDADKLSKTQFIELFMNPPEYKPNDIEDIRNLFQIFDVKDKGSFSKADFIEFFKFSPIYQSNPELVEDNLEKCFVNIQKIFGNREITPVEFFQIINQNKTQN